ncbi:hypothetical protein BH24ACT15_BH24ACT15_05270 [soil metagenome]
MALDSAQLMADFASAATATGFERPPLRYEHLPAPHRPRGLPTGFGAVYVFTLAARWWPGAPGAGRVLKVGRVGPNSDARFCSQHYNPTSSSSNLANTLLTARVLWPYLGIEGLDATTVGEWIKNNTERDHFFVPAGAAAIMPILETYVRGRLAPVFEGG